MELGSVFLVLAVLVIVGMYLYAPFTERAQNINIDDTHEISALKAERERVLTSLQELDFDFKLGKIPAEDYPEQRQSLLQKGADVLRQLDEMDSTDSSLLIGEGLGVRSESKVSNDELEAMLAARRKEKKSKSAGFCPNCGKPVLATDHFCPSCGKALS
ncbi:MAG: zinc ribbon domain-containing protein [Anaerolineales bacterium]|nr:zinc ribbon domain-containing protein [Anaerolineales bacterium]